MLQKLTNVKKLRQHGVEISQFACQSDFTWSQILVNSNSQKMSFLALSEVMNLNFCKFEAFLKFKNYQNSKLRVSEIVKMAIFDIQILPKFISCKIEWQINICIVNLNFTFWKFLEHSACESNFPQFLHCTHRKNTVQMLVQTVCYSQVSWWYR